MSGTAAKVRLRLEPLFLVVPALLQTRRPKAEIRKKAEARNPKRGNGVRPGVKSFRVSDFGFLSDFGLRLSDFRQATHPKSLTHADHTG